MYGLTIGQDNHAEKPVFHFAGGLCRM